MLRSLDLPPVYMLLSGLVMYGLDRWVPVWTLPSQDTLRMAGVWVAVAGLVPAILAAVRMFRARTTVHPHHQPSALVTDGIFALSRNPIYVTDVLLLAGWALWLGSLSAWLGLPLFVTVVTRRAIRPEEARLAATFGRAYDDYRARVRRWL
ncbi:MAG: isoprenylcysteine carboxylmethyltransferase family protein [Geminicoccaceae bacterium]|nr:isoprenylcysteine carboxylmethyltransferase family protein [Geminicoccaceae bacterium]